MTFYFIFFESEEEEEEKKFLFFFLFLNFTLGNERDQHTIVGNGSTTKAIHG